MSLGGFTALVKTMNSRLSGGFNHRGESYVDAEMELVGRLHAFHYGDLKEHITRQTKTSVNVTIQFAQTQLIPWDNDGDGKPYIGTIQLFDQREVEVVGAEIHANVNIALPISMFQQLLLMERKSILFDTIHDVIQIPNDRQKDLKIVALVKRAYFAVTGECELARE